MKALLRTLVGIVFLAAATNSAAYTVYGAGATSCGTWLEERRSGNFYTTGQWLLGFVSAVGFMGMNLKESDGQGMLAWVDNYCSSHPLEDVDAAAYALVYELRREN